MDLRAHLLDLIRRVAGGDMSVSEFERAYQAAFIDSPCLEGALDATDEAFFDEVWEKLDGWVTPSSPSAEDRAYGYITEEEFVRWVAQELNKFSHRQPVCEHMRLQTSKIASQ